MKRCSQEQDTVQLLSKVTRKSDDNENNQNNPTRTKIKENADHLESIIGPNKYMMSLLVTQKT